MRPETKQLIQSKTHRWLEGEQTHALDPQGTWIHVRDIRAIIDCETELLKKQIEKLKHVHKSPVINEGTLVVWST